MTVAAAEHEVLWPEHEEIVRVAEVFWKSPAENRRHLTTSSVAVEGSFKVPDEVELDEATFCKLIALVQPSTIRETELIAVRDAATTGYSALERLALTSCCALTPPVSLAPPPAAGAIVSSRAARR